MARCILFRDYDGTTFELDTPLTAKILYEQVRKDLQIPDYVPRSDFHIERGLVTIWAGLNAHRMDQILPQVPTYKVAKESVPVLFFGGAAVRMLCPSANNQSGPFFRQLNDVDLIAPKNRAQDFYKLLLALGDLCGTRYHYFVTRSDRRFNAMRAGKRYRVRTIEKMMEDGSVQSGILDIFTDSVDLRHKVDVREMFHLSKEELYTVGLHNILLTKCQYIFDAKASTREELVRQQLDYRILDYPHYRNDRFLVGIEEKDMKDLCALFLDHEVGEGEGKVDLERIYRVLESDKKFALTFRLNLENILRNENMLKEIGISGADIAKIFPRIQSVLDAVPKVEKKWNNPWWDVDVETPQIFGKSSS